MVTSLIVAYILSIAQIEETCEVNYKPWIIGETIICFFSAGIDFKMFTIKYASDERWFRIIFMILF